MARPEMVGGRRAGRVVGTVKGGWGGHCGGSARSASTRRLVTTLVWAGGAAWARTAWSLACAHADLAGIGGSGGSGRAGPAGSTRNEESSRSRRSPSG
jgi:hypothetical protein